MRCDRCGQREAVIHETLIDQSGAKLERHLCETCAVAAAQAGTSAIEGMQGLVAGLASDAMDALHAVAEESTKARKGPGPLCPACGTTFAKFRKSGLLGCPACYEAFGDRLGKLIERAHEGGVCHIGKSPKRAGPVGRMGVSVAGRAGSQTTQTQMASLRKQLDAAVRGEQYERAAALKVEIERLSAVLERGADADGGDEPGAPAGGSEA